jgi:hypothetical protein
MYVAYVRMYVCMYIYIYIYIFVCVCVCVCARVRMHCYMLGFLGNMTSALCCVTMGLLRFLSNATVPVA